MIRARLSNGDFLFGLTVENIERLVAGMPIAVNLGELGGPDQRLMIMYGDTQEDILIELREAGALREGDVQ
jgi:hypothetical protein